MKGRGVSLFVALVAAAVVPSVTGAYQQEQPAAKFRSSVDVVSVTAVVRDRKGRFVRDLDRDDFTVVEAGQPKPILDFRALSDGPVRVALLVDVSGSMRVGGKAVDARQAAKHIFSTLRPGDEAAVFAFDTQLEQVRGFTSDVAALESALDRVNPPFGQTSLYDAVAETARAISNERASGTTPQRKAVIVLTDGIDTRSRLTPEQVANIAGGIDVPVYVLAVMASVDDPRHAADGSAAERVGSTLTQLSRGTGGELFTATAPAHASLAARQIVDELRHQYVLAFEASARAGWRPVEIRSRDRDHIVRARSGYSGSG